MKRIQLTHQDILQMLPHRAADSHKGDYGKLLLLCGSRGYTGAAALAAMGALRTGAGLVFLGVPESIYQIEAVKLTEPIVFPLAEEDGKLSAACFEELNKWLTGMDALLLGPGLGQSDGVQTVVKEILRTFPGPLVLDADGINQICAHKDILRGRTAPTVLTPHMGEFARLLGREVQNRESDALDFAANYGVTLLLKGHNTIVTDGNCLYINQTGNPGMAVGGSGDVLSGMIVSLIGQGLPVTLAAACGAWLHGAAGDICAEQIGQYGMLPTDMLLVLPRLMK